MSNRLGWLILVVVVAGVWSPIVVRDTHWLSDDWIFIVEARPTWKGAFERDSYAAVGYRGAEAVVYRPLGVMGLRGETALFGVRSTRPWHAVSVALQVGAAALLAAWLMALGVERRAALVAAALWGVSPVHAEAVAWATAQFQLASTLLLLAALWATARGRIAAAALAFAVALLVKETAVAALPVLFLTAWLRLRRRAWVAAGVLTLLTAGAFALRAHAGVHSALPERLSLPALLGAAGGGCLRFLGLHDLVEVAGPPLHAPTLAQLGALVALAVLAGWAIARRGLPAVAVAALLLVPLPALAVGQRQLSVFPESDQWFHLAAAAVPALVAVTAQGRGRRRALAAAVFALAWLSTRAVIESAPYRDFVSVLDRRVELGQDSAYVRYVRAVENLRADPCEAALDFARCLALPGPDDGRAQCARDLQPALARCARVLGR